MSSHPTAPSGREAVDSYSLSRKNIEFGAMNRHQAVPHERYAHASSSKRNEPLSPSFAGFIETTYDAMLLLESCLQARSFHVNRRPQDKERSKCITSGATFVYEESASGIKRWTDGFNWSPSRIMGNFLVYRELDNKVPANERKLTKRKRGCGARESSSSPVAKKESRMVAGKSVSIDDPSLRPFVGSLVDSYDFKENGLCKKTISIMYNGVNHHVVNYYNPWDALSGRLETPTGMAKQNLQSFHGVRYDLFFGQSFRTDLDGIEGYWVQRCASQDTSGQVVNLIRRMFDPQPYTNPPPPLMDQLQRTAADMAFRGATQAMPMTFYSSPARNSEAVLPQMTIPPSLAAPATSSRHGSTTSLDSRQSSTIETPDQVMEPTLITNPMQGSMAPRNVSLTANVAFHDVVPRHSTSQPPGMYTQVYAPAPSNQAGDSITSMTLPADIQASWHGRTSSAPPQIALPGEAPSAPYSVSGYWQGTGSSA